MANASAAENQAADSNHDPLHGARAAREFAPCVKRPSSTEEIVVTTHRGDVVRVHVFPANDRPVVALAGHRVFRAVETFSASPDMLAIHDAARARAFTKKHRHDRHMKHYRDKHPVAV